MRPKRTILCVDDNEQALSIRKLMLETRGYRVLAENLWIGGYELDLVLRRGRTIVFCEVKAKRGAAKGDPLEMVTPEKVRRLRQAAEAWLVANPQPREFEVRFDVAAERMGKLQVVANAF